MKVKIDNGKDKCEVFQKAGEGIDGTSVEDLPSCTPKGQSQV